MITLTVGNIFQLISFTGPLILGFFMVIMSVFNQDIRGIIYLAGVLIASIINSLLMDLIGEERSNSAPPLFCSVFNLREAETKYKSPSPTMLFLAFTATYLLLPMRSNDEYNYAVIVFLIALVGIDWVTKVQSGCTSNSGAALGILVGVLLGIAWYSTIHSTGYKSLLYFNALNSNKVMCSKPSSQTFKCSVYKNGQLLTSTSM